MIKRFSKLPETDLESLNDGDVFVHNDYEWIKTKNKDGLQTTCLRISDGSLFEIDNDSIVILKPRIKKMRELIKLDQGNTFIYDNEDWMVTNETDNDQQVTKVVNLVTGYLQYMNDYQSVEVTDYYYGE